MISILLAEDDRALSALVKTYLIDGGYEVTACFDGDEALAAMESKRFDMIVTDVMMPKTDGFELARRVRESGSDIPILFMTALDDKPSKQLGYKLGIDDYVVKPFDADLLVLRVAAILRRANIEKSRELVAAISG